MEEKTHTLTCTIAEDGLYHFTFEDYISPAFYAELLDLLWAWGYGEDNESGIRGVTRTAE